MSEFGLSGSLGGLSLEGFLCKVTKVLLETWRHAYVFIESTVYIKTLNGKHIQIFRLRE